jgi:hypothetical protein
MEIYKKEWFRLLSFALPFIVIVALTRMDYPVQGDEKNFFYPCSKDFGHDFSLETLKSYGCPEPPLPFVIFGLFGRLFNFSLTALRIFNMLLSYVAVVILYKLLKRVTDYAYYLSYLFLVFPYYLVLTSSMVYTEPITFIFALLGLYFYIFKERSLLGGFFSGLAVLCRQYFIFLPATFIIVEYFSNRKLIFDIKMLLNSALPFLIYLPFVVIWKGLVPAGSPQHFTSPYLFNFAAFNYLLISVAVYGFPFVSFSLKTLLPDYRLKIIAALCLTPVFFLGLPDKAHPIILNTGPFFRLANYFGSFNTFVFYAAWLAGLYILFSLIGFKLRHSEKVDSYCVYGIILFCIMMLFSPFMWEKYILQIYPLLIIFFGRRMGRNIPLMILWLVAFAVMSIYSFIHFLIHVVL